MEAVSPIFFVLREKAAPPSGLAGARGMCCVIILDMLIHFEQWVVISIVEANANLKIEASTTKT